jgi:hypothetical protein
VHRPATINSLQGENGCLIVEIVCPWQEWFQVEIDLEIVSNLVEAKTTIVGNKNTLNLKPGIDACRVSISNRLTKSLRVNSDSLGVRIVVTSNLLKSDQHVLHSNNRTVILHTLKNLTSNEISLRLPLFSSGCCSSTTCLTTYWPFSGWLTS